MFENCPKNSNKVPQNPNWGLSPKMSSTEPSAPIRVKEIIKAKKYGNLILGRGLGKPYNKETEK